LTEPNMTGSQCWALGRMGCGHYGFQKPNSEFLSSRKEGEAAGVSGAGLTSVWLREAVVGAGWWGGEGSWAERETLRETVVLTLGLQVTMRGRGRRPGNPDIPSGPPKTSVEHSVWIRALGSQVPPERPPIWPQPYNHWLPWQSTAPGTGMETPALLGSGSVDSHPHSLWPLRFQPVPGS